MLTVVNKKKFVKGIIIILVTLAIVIMAIYWSISGIISMFKNKKATKQNEIKNSEQTAQTQTAAVNNANSEKISQWYLKLVNKDNSVDKDYVPELEELDDGIKFDKRAISYLRDMINAMYKSGTTKIWVQSGYRSYEKQEELFNNKVNYYKNKGKSQEEAEILAQTIVQRPEMSEHNLGLAADFNTVNNEFTTTKAFKWLEENAQNYGFILRYPKDKQDITGISYESWHWRYVGIEDAKIMKEKGYCLEEYIEYLKGNVQI